MSRTIVARPLSQVEFAPFGDVIDAGGQPDWMINEGRCGRFHDRARIDIADRAGLSVFQADPVTLPVTLPLVERHPLGSQAFLPMSDSPFLVVVAPDEGGVPGQPVAFVAGPGQGVNIGRNVWHGVLTPLGTRGLFAVLDRCAEGPNLEEHRFDPPWRVEAPATR